MKKTLLGTTALVSAGLAAGPAMADPLTVSVGGYVVTGFYAIGADDFQLNGADYEPDDTKVAVVARNILIDAEGTLDNGMVAGAHIKMQLGDDEGNNAKPDDATFQEFYGHIEGGFGRVELGGTDGAAFKMHYTSPWFVPGNGVDSPNIYNAVFPTASGNSVGSVAARTSTFSLMAEDSNKLTYFTPRLAGFQLGLSYSPNSDTLDPSANGFGIAGRGSRFTYSGTNDVAVDQVFEVAANYAGEFGGIDLGVDGWWTTANGNTGDGSDPEEFGGGANFGAYGFTLGGAYYQSQDLNPGYQNVAMEGGQVKVFTAGLSYGTGPWTVGFAYLKGMDLTDGYAVTPTNQMWQVGGGYSLGSGVDIGLDVQFITTDPGGNVTRSYDDTSGGLLLAFSF